MKQPVWVVIGGLKPGSKTEGRDLFYTKTFLGSHDISKKPMKKPIKKSAKNQKIALIYRPYKSEALALAKEVAPWLKQQGCSLFRLSEQKQLSEAAPLSTGRQIDALDLVIVFGGDGSYLNAVKLLGDREIPILGINMGSMGFLTEIRSEDVYPVLEQALKGRLPTQSRAMMEVEVFRGKKRLSRSLALNDVVLERGAVPRLIHFSIQAGGELLSQLKADGLIVATPTGSTAYSLAAGGPILHPAVKALVVTPICAHSLTHRPMTLPDSHEVKLQILDPTPQAVFMVDGFRGKDLTPQDTVIIHKAKTLHWMMTMPHQSYFDLLRKKLTFDHRT